MKNKIINLNKELLKREKNLKKELKNLILKSIIQNLNVKPKYRCLAIKKMSKTDLKSFLSKQKDNICKKSGRFKGNLNKFQLSRHCIKKLSLNGYIQNIKMNSW